ncbi:MAG: PqqD family protein [Rhizomicrobium sp.]
MRFTPADNVIGTKVEDEFLLLQFETQNYFGLRGAAVRIWELMQHGATGADIVQRLVQETDVGEERARTDVADTLQRLLDAGLLRAA